MGTEMVPIELKMYLFSVHTFYSIRTLHLDWHSKSWCVSFQLKSQHYHIRSANSCHLGYP
jgi:hypothetical protein